MKHEVIFSDDVLVVVYVFFAWALQNDLRDDLKIDFVIREPETYP